MQNLPQELSSDMLLTVKAIVHDLHNFHTSVTPGTQFIQSIIQIFPLICHHLYQLDTDFLTMKNITIQYNQSFYQSFSNLYLKALKKLKDITRIF